MTRSPAISFIVRVWNGESNPEDLRGEVEHVQSGEKRFFLDYASLARLIDSWRQDLRPATTSMADAGRN